MALTKLQVEHARPRDKSYKVFDGRGLYLEVMPHGSRLWRFKYRIAGKEKRIALGLYPDVGLKDARERLDVARRQVAAGIDPSERRKAEKIALAQKNANSFEAVAREWFAMHSKKWEPSHGDKIIRRLELNIFPWIGKRPVREVTAPELLAVLRRIESRGANETAHRAMQNCGSCLSLCDRNGAR